MFSPGEKQQEPSHGSETPFMAVRRFAASLVLWTHIVYCIESDLRRAYCSSSIQQSQITLVITKLFLKRQHGVLQSVLLFFSPTIVFDLLKV